MTRFYKVLFLICSLIFISSCTSIVRFGDNSETSTKNWESKQEEFFGSERGFASYYGDEFDGRATASGEIFSQARFTAAHKTLPFGTKLLVKNLENGKICYVIVNDRGPFVKGRIIDLSKSAAEELGMLKKGIIEVEIKIIK